MSIGNAVFLKLSAMPTPAAWAEAIRKHGFALELDRDFNVETHSGFLPCQLEGQPAGFEYFYELVADAELELSAKERRRLGDRDLMVSFVTHSSMIELASAVIASAVLAQLTGGVHWDQEANEFSSGDAAIKYARDVLADAKAPKPPPKAAAPAAPLARDVQLAATIVFRGATLLTLETQEPTPRRFTARFDTSKLPANSDPTIASLWEQPAGVSIRVLRAGSLSWTFDPSGAELSPEGDLRRHAEQLGKTESATRALIAAGAAAVPLLVPLATNEQTPPNVRQMAIVILGQVGASVPAAKDALSSLMQHPQLGALARDALRKVGG